MALFLIRLVRSGRSWVCCIADGEGVMALVPKRRPRGSDFEQAATREDGKEEELRKVLPMSLV
jgi:hypothetical protein